MAAPQSALSTRGSAAVVAVSSVDRGARGRIALFARPIVAGQTKTRLAAALGAQGAAQLYAAFLADVVDTCRSVANCELQLWVAGDPQHPSLDGIDLPRVRQPDTDLGGRMAAALSHDPGPTLVIGSDAPTMPAALLHQGLSALRDGACDVVLGPAADGGFALIGASDRPPPLSAAIRWSHRCTGADTLAACRRVGLRVAQLTPSYDVDTPDDLRVLATHLALQPGAAPASAAALAALGAGFLTRESRSR